MKAKFDINKIYDDYSKHLYFSSLRIVGDSHDAQEIMQESIIRYYKFPNKEGIIDIRKWLTTICIRKSLDKLRERNRNKIFLEEYKEHSLNELDKQVPIDRLSVQNIKEAIGLLPDNYRIIFSLHLIEGYDYQEISQITGIRESTIRTLYSRAKNKIKELIKG